MYRTVLSFYLIVHIMPFIYVAGYHGLFELVPIAIILAALPFGIFCGVITVNKGQPPTIVVPSMSLVIPLSVTAAVYFLARSQTIIEIFVAITHGEYFAYALSLAQARYESGGGASVLEKLGMIVFFVFSMLLGSHIGSMRLRRTMFFVAIFVIMVLVESSSLARAGVVIALVSAFVEFLVRRSREFYLIRRRKLIFQGLFAVLVLAAIFVFSAYFRVQGSEDAWIIVAEKTAHYAAAPYSALVTWFHEYDGETLEMGASTFAFVYKLLGIEYMQGAVAPIMTPIGSTNLFLIYRGLIQDFTLVGAAMIMWLVGAMSVIYTFNPANIFGYLLLRVGLLFVFFPFYSVFYFSTFAIAFVLVHLAYVLSWSWQIHRCRELDSLGHSKTFTSSSLSPKLV